MKMSKKAVSGLIVAVLLLAVALTIGGLVMGWISSYSDTNLSSADTDAKRQDECFDRDFKVVSVNASGPVGISGWAKIVIENKNDKIIKGFLFKFIADNDNLYAFENKSSTAELGGYVRNTYLIGYTDLNTALNNSFSNSTSPHYNISKVEITPIIDITVDTTQEVVCDSKMKSVSSTNFVNN